MKIYGVKIFRDFYEDFDLTKWKCCQITRELPGWKRRVQLLGISCQFSETLKLKKNR